MIDVLVKGTAMVDEGQEEPTGAMCNRECLKQCAMDQMVCPVASLKEGLPLRRHLPHSLSEKKSTGGRVNPLQSGSSCKQSIKERERPKGGYLLSERNMYKAARERRAEDVRAFQLEVTMRRFVNHSSEDKASSVRHPDGKE